MVRFILFTHTKVTNSLLQFVLNISFFGNQRKRTKHSPGNMRAAVLSLVNEQSSIQGAAKYCDIDRKTLERYVTNYRLSENKNEVSFKPNYETGQVFSDQLELMLADYLKLAAKFHYGLSQKTVRNFVYEFGHANNIKLRVEKEGFI